ncbi:hypothetical protein NC661_04890 [Aquibacillus koreensis]|uniref:Uncharacterized protein n=1 Tax=Aquibacillus koreensis TaxID=279446 RepID=A0A9X3WM20_9BACI|nr:hypothetical protein [Aquibacillus koreensis]MCT2534689.1 hypothetical protein [Aquibacillus koreensis]MDC3419701.1 hypothetical protein [Aquibacillus koreensis]
MHHSKAWVIVWFLVAIVLIGIGFQILYLSGQSQPDTENINNNTEVIDDEGAESD